MSPFNCLITGATSGIGKAAAFALARSGNRLILVGRNEAKLSKAARAIGKGAKDTDIASHVCDISILRDVRDLAERIKGRHDRLDVIINNAGGRYLRHQMTGEGFELTLATNHLGHFVLTLSLIRLLRNSRSPRIVNVSSGAHYRAGGVIRNILPDQHYDGRLQYAESKLANVLFTYALADRLRAQGICVNAVDPGVVATNFARNNGSVSWFKHRFSGLMKRELRTPAEGADTVVYLASSEDLEKVTGGYFRDRKALRSSEISYDKGIQEELWTTSVGWSGLDLPH